MPQDVEPPGGLSFGEAFFKFTDPGKHEAWEDAQGAWSSLEWAKNPPTIEDTEWADLLDPKGESKPRPKPDRRELRKAEQARDKAFAVAWDEFTIPLRSGNIVAFAHPSAVPSSEPRSRMAADLWDDLCVKSNSRDGDAPVLEGRGRVFHDLRFHRANDLKEWRRGARLPLAFRSLDPILWARYEAIWAPDKAPAEFNEEERQYHGGYDRQ